MFKLYLYLETLVLGSIYLFLSKVLGALAAVGNNAEWYSQNGIHFWEKKKALACLDKQTKDMEQILQKFYEEMQKDEKDEDPTKRS